MHNDTWIGKQGNNISLKKSKYEENFRSLNRDRCRNSLKYQLNALITYLCDWKTAFPLLFFCPSSRFSRSLSSRPGKKRVSRGDEKKGDRKKAMRFPRCHFVEIVADKPLLLSILNAPSRDRINHKNLLPSGLLDVRLSRRNNESPKESRTRSHFLAGSSF